MNSADLNTLFPPSEPCSCPVCQSYCKRPGWWTVTEFKKILQSNYYKRIMLELSPELTFGVLSPAFKGCENNFALQNYAEYGCNFYNNHLCDLYSPHLQPLECRFCHHDRTGKGMECHTAIEQEWNSNEGRQLIELWMIKTDFPYKEYYHRIIQKG